MNDVLFILNHYCLSLNITTCIYSHQLFNAWLKIYLRT